MLKSFFQNSGWKVLLWAFLGYLITAIPQWAQAVTLPAPWDGILNAFVSFLVGGIRMWLAYVREPSMDATQLPPEIVATLPPKQQARVEAAQARKEEKEGPPDL